MIPDNFFLGITTTENETGLALIRKDEILYQHCETFEDNHGTSLHNETIFYLIKSAFDKVGITARDLSGIGVVLGPGKFTSLRVGLACAKGLALPYEIKIKGFNTLEALAFSVREVISIPQPIIVPIVDIKRGEVYYQIYQGTHVMSEPKIIPADKISEIFPERSILVGSGVARYRDLVTKSTQLSYTIFDTHYPSPRAVAKYARKAILLGQYDELTNLTPIYLRPV
ncbi:MAG: tRNA (adenosine(37)-N6)-threonylcarbamoyltransferase complex dimerization subunit type 1 TsaB [candidate division WOR-3 bacterium]